MKKTILITGASSGIGREFALIHTKTGGNLVIVARSEDKLNGLKQEIESAHKVAVTVIAKRPHCSQRHPGNLRRSQSSGN
jgi:short-subunit dehydrogenase